jgi:hypothetical protein
VNDDDAIPDDPVVARLRALAAAHDPPPALLVDAARAAIGWRDPDAALARLVADSALDAEPAAARGAGTRLLSFATDAAAVEVEVSQVAGGLRVFGQVLPPPSGPARLELRRRDGVIEVPIDPGGRFDLAPVPPGPVSVRLVTGAGVTVSEWVAI